MRLATTILALPVLAAATPALAQAYQCRVPSTLPAVPKIAPDGPVRRIPVEGYSLSLSWSPEYCRGRESRAADAIQCSGRNGRFGLVVHGLWPEGSSGRWPQWCPTPRTPSPALLRQHLCLTPSTRLMAHEWAKHGACMVRHPETYFRIGRILWDSLRLPDLDRLSRQDGLNAGAIRQAFVDGNPAWKPEQIGVRLNARGWLKEVRLCYGKDFMPARCTPGQFGARNAAKAKIWRGL
ncbi:ribonuclease T [Croceicoccus estronivorus]|nr:ribonuclease T [Croceicoccus estronivorus]